MAEGGKIIRIIGGKSTWIAEKRMDIIATEGDVVFSSPKRVNLEGIEGGREIGVYDWESKYFEEGWWSSDYEGNEKITKAKIGDNVYFQVRMTKKFPESKLPTDRQKIISFNLYEFDGNKYKIGYIWPIITVEKEPKKEKDIPYITWKDVNNNDEIDPEEEHTQKPYTKVEAKENKAVISFRLTDGLLKRFNEFAELKLFMSLSYHWENVDLPETEDLYLDIEPKPPVVKEIYVRLLNYQVSQVAINRLNEVGGSIQYIKGNDEFMSEKVNMDYFSVRIDELPKFANGNIMILYKKIRENFLTLSKGNVTFKTHSANQISVNGKWEFKPYPKEDDPEYSQEQLRRWSRDLGGSIFLIEAGSDNLAQKPMADHGAVLESETSPYEMSWIFTTIVTEKSDTQPFSGHRQFGIHKDEEGNYRFFARAIDRIWPSQRVLFGSENKDRAVKDYLTIADSTWNNLIRNVSQYILHNGGKTRIMEPEIERTNFYEFLNKYKTEPTLKIGNIPQYKEISENEI